MDRNNCPVLGEMEWIDAERILEKMKFVSKDPFHYIKRLSEHSCSLGDFYIEEIVVDSRYRRKGIGSFLLRGIPKDRLKSIVVDTPLINKQAITFYRKSGFVKVLGLSEEFYKTWTRMSKPV